MALERRDFTSRRLPLLQAKARLVEVGSETSLILVALVFRVRRRGWADLGVAGLSADREDGTGDRDLEARLASTGGWVVETIVPFRACCWESKREDALGDLPRPVVESPE